MIALYYYENLTLREIGEVLGVTESRVSQLHTKAVLRLRSRMQEESFERRPLRARPLGARRAAGAGRHWECLSGWRMRRWPTGFRTSWRGSGRRYGAGPRQKGDRVMRPAADRIRNVALVGHRGAGQDVAARGAAVRGGRDQPPGLGARRDHRLGLRPRRAGAADVDLGDAQLVRVATSARSTCSTRPASRASSPTRSARCACASRRCSWSTR